MAKAKTINLLLEDGNLEGLLTIEDSSWDGIMFVSPRESVGKLFHQDETNYWGVYLLISDNQVYIGQASELQKRIKQHDKSKDFWKKAVLITTRDDSLNRSAIDYIEHELIEKSKKSGTLHSENKQAGNKAKVSRFDKVKYDNFIENSLLLLELLGIKVFVKNQKVKNGDKKAEISKKLDLPKDNSEKITRKMLIEEISQHAEILEKYSGFNTPRVTEKKFSKIKLFKTEQISKSGVKLTREIIPNVHVYVNYNYHDNRLALGQYQQFFNEHEEKK
ncbi:MAG: GIY-YIG nuclease family protein [Streptococcaceae bacterium]|jgi:hypothetical protein|nr:GIY-YIG nuclease family protein [Streptococcaceae bacterium]